MAYLNAGAAVVLPSQFPSSYNVLQEVLRRNREFQDKQEQDQKEEETRKNLLTKYVGENFDPGNFDALLGQQLAGKRAQWAKFIHDNPNANMSDLAMGMQGDLSKLSQYSNAIKMGRDQIKNESGAFKDYKGIDYNAASNAALRNYLYKKDPNGQFALKGVDELGDPSGMVKKEIYDHPDLFLTKEATPFDDLTKEPTTTEGDQYTFINSHKGAEKRGYDFEYYPSYQKVVKGEGKDPVIVPRSEVMKWPDGSPFLDDNKKPIMGADPLAWQRYISNPVRELTLLKRFNAQHGGAIDPQSPAGQAFLKQMALEDISGIAPKKHKISATDKQNPIVVNNNANSESKDDYKDSPVKYIIGAMNGDPSVLNYAQPDPSTKQYDLSPALGEIGNQPDVHPGNPRSKPTRLTRLLFDPHSPEKGVTAYWRDYKYKPDGSIDLDEKGAPIFEPTEQSKTYAPHEIAPWLEKMANLIPAEKKRRDVLKYIRENKINIPKPKAGKPTAMGNVIDTMYGLLGNNNA